MAYTPFRLPGRSSIGKACHWGSVRHSDDADFTNHSENANRILIDNRQHSSPGAATLPRGYDPQDSNMEDRSDDRGFQWSDKWPHGENIYVTSRDDLGIHKVRLGAKYSNYNSRQSSIFVATVTMLGSDNAKKCCRFLSGTHDYA